MKKLLNISDFPSDNENLKMMEKYQKKYEFDGFEIKKFDYRYKDEPWKNSKDALVRTLCKTNGVTDEE